MKKNAPAAPPTISRIAITIPATAPPEIPPLLDFPVWLGAWVTVVSTIKIWTMKGGYGQW